VTRTLAVAALLALAVAALAGGTAPFGRLALTLGLPRAAAALFRESEWRGVALYRAGRYDEAAQEFRASRATGAYNLGTSLARAGRYAEALEALDAAMAQNRQDAEAAANFDLVASIYAGTELIPEAMVTWWEQREGATADAPEGQGSGRAASTGDEATNTGALIGLPELSSRNQFAVRKVFDAKYIRASPLWLETLADVPGEYLAARIKAEQKRRIETGIAPPPTEDPS
jgi:Ca-activated chloride channel family protein